MKSLNRTLSLVLVLVMVFGLFGVASATTYTDNSTIKYTEAVDVISSIGVINGTDGNNFDPKGNLTREQAAKIICYLTIGKSAADTLKATVAPFTDVAADRWSAGSIAYCVSQGIIAGRGDKTFDPTANVTGYEFSKMLLVALGYDAAIEGLTGDSWSINTAKLSFANSLYLGNDAFNGTASATREEAALYTLNLLSAKTVSYATKGTSIVVNGTSITTGASAAAQGVATFNSTYYSTLVATSGTDAFGRTARVWTLKGVQVGAYAKAAAYTTTTDLNYTAGIASLSASLKGYTFTALDRSNVTRNGVPEGAVGAISAINSVTALAALTGNGTVVQVYTNPAIATQIVGISVIKTDLAKVAAVDTVNKTVALTTVSSAAVQGSYTISASASATLYAAVKDVAVGSLVLVTPTWTGSAYAVASVAMPTTAAGFITTVNTATGSIYLDGKAYDTAAAQTLAVAAAGPSGTVGATLVLDTYGYVVHCVAASVASKNFFFTLDSYNTLVNGQIVPMAKGVLTDGTIVDVVATGAAAGLQTIGTIANDVYPLTNASAGTPGSAGAIAAAKTTVALKSTGVINAYDKTLTSATQTGANYYGNYYSANVKFVYINTAAKTATVKTGVQAVASIPAGSFAVTEVNSATDATPVVTAVYLVDGVAATVDSTSLLYVTTGTSNGTTILKNTTTGKYETFNLYSAYLNGVAVDGGIATISSVSANSFYSFAKSDTTGAYVLAPYTIATGTSAIISDTAISSTFSNTLINVGGALIDVTSAVFADTRTSAQKAANPVILNAAGICAAATKNAKVSVVYNQLTGKAALVFVTSVDTGFALSYTNTNYLIYTDAACTTAVVTGTKIAAGTTLYVRSTSTVAATSELTAVTPATLTSVAAAVDGTSAAIYSFKMTLGTLAFSATQS